MNLLPFILLKHVASFQAMQVDSRRSRTGFVIYLNKILDHFLFKKQGSFKMSTFGSDFVSRGVIAVNLCKA